MTANYNMFCDDFYVDMFINTQMELPNDRDMLFTFFERIQKQFPDMANFFRRDNGDFCLESDREAGSYRWVAMELDRLSAGVVNPDNIQYCQDLHKTILDLSPHMLGLSYLDINSLDVCFAMDFDFTGNHNEVIAEALFGNSPMACMLDNSQAKAISLSPGFIISLDDSCRLQAKLTIESRTNVYEIRTGKYKESEPISLYFTIRQYPQPNVKFNANEGYKAQMEILQEYMQTKIIPNFVCPLTKSISQRR